TVTLSNATTNATGRVAFAEGKTPWPAGTTATAPTLDLTLPEDGGWQDFVIAGEFPHASTADHDTTIVATAAWVEVGSTSLMDRVRTDGQTLTPDERDRFLKAVARLPLVDRGYDTYVQIHNGAIPEGHGGPAFLPWHRAFVLHLERSLQKIDPSVALPYWKFD